MKKALSILLSASFMLSMAACSSTETGSSGGGSTGGSTNAGASNGDNNTGDSSSESTYRMAMICDSSISDGGWGAACYTAMVDAATELNWSHDYTDNISVADYVDSISSYCQLGYDLVFLPGNQYIDATLQVAVDYPDVNFAILNGDEAVVADNIWGMMPDVDQIGYLAGGLAGLTSETGVLGFIGGMELDTTIAKLEGYEAAAKALNPETEVLSAYAGSFSDTAKGMELANGMLSQGADVFFGDASAVDSGARQALDSANTEAGEMKFYDIGQPSDLLGQNPCVIGSVVTDNATMLRLCMEDIQQDGTGSVVEGDLSNGCLSIGELNAELLTQEQIDAYLALVDEIMAGTFPS